MVLSQVPSDMQNQLNDTSATQVLRPVGSALWTNLLVQSGGTSLDDGGHLAAETPFRDENWASK